MYEKELTYAVEAAQTAADLLRESFASGYQDEVDEQAEQRIFELLTGVFPLYGYRGEELGLRRHPRDELKHLRLIDPHDGTAAAKDGYRGAAVSIALLCSGFPVLGVVYAYAAPDSRGDLFTWAAGLGPVRRNGIEAVRRWPGAMTSEGTTLVSHHADGNSLANARLVEPMRYRQCRELPTAWHYSPLVKATSSYH